MDFRSMTTQCLATTFCLTLLGEFASAGSGDTPQAPAQQPAAAPASNDIRVFWKDGFRMETADKAFTLKFGGRAQYDFAFFDADDADFGTEFKDGTELRRMYLSLGGTVWGNVDYQLETNLAKSGTDVQDTYLQTKTSAGTVRVGHFKTPIGMEDIGSDLNTAFLERTLTSAMKLGRDTGVQLTDTFAEDLGTWTVGIFKDGSNDQAKNSSDADYAFTGRVTYVPWTENEGKRMANVGLAYSHRSTDSDPLTFSTKPEANLAPTVLSETIADTEGYDLVGLESAVIFDAFTFAAEYMQAMISSDAAGDPDLTGWYAYATYMLTGESRTWNKSNATFGRVKPASNYGKGGWGAWELGLRYSEIDFGDVGTGSATVDDITAGVNWYLNPHTKLMANVVQTTVDDEDNGIDSADATVFQLRFQVDI